VARPASRGGEDGLIGLQIIPKQSRDQLLLIPTVSLALNDILFPLCWGLEKYHLGCLYGEDFLPRRLIEKFPRDWSLLLL
jgi:hypothetical protein